MVKNIYYDSTKDMYKVSKKINGKMVHFGQFKNKEDAILAKNMFEENGWKVEDNWKIRAQVREIIKKGESNAS